MTVTFFNYIHLSFTMKFILLATTYQNKKLATATAFKCIKNHMAACVNIMKTLSIYSWNNKIEDCEEFLVIFKTTKQNKQILVNFIQKNHSYNTPEIIEINATSLCHKYSDWLTLQTLKCDRKPE